MSFFFLIERVSWACSAPIKFVHFRLRIPEDPKRVLHPLRAGVLVSFKASGSGHRDLQQADALASSGPGIMSRDSCELRAGFSMSWELLWAEIVLARRGSIFFHAVLAAFVSGHMIRILFRTVYFVTAHRLSTKRIA